MIQTSTDFLKQLQRFTAAAMITPSTLRNVGARGVLHVAQDFLSELSLQALSQMNGDRYLAWLDEQTTRLRASFPERAQRWGAARKALNIFMRTAVYTLPLADAYQLAPLLPSLEVPLDRDVATALRSSAEGKAAHLPPWVSIVSLDADRSRMYQSVATTVAQRLGVCRADLDVYYWGVRSSS